MWFQPNPRGLSSLRGNTLTLAYLASCGIGFMMFGYDQAVLGTLSTQPGFLAAIGTKDSLIIGWVLSFFSVGAAFGCVGAIIFGYRTGRRPLIALGCVLMSVGAALQAASFHLAQMLVGRFVSGLGIGLVTSSVPVLLVETAQSHRRGQIISTLFVMGVLGIALADWIDYGVIIHSSNPEFIWRFPVAFQAAFCLVTIPTIFLLPESPRWLFAIGRVEDANEIIAKMYATTTSSDIVTKIRAALQVEVEIESSTEEKGWRLFLTCVRAIFYDTTQLKLGRRLRLCILITFLQEMSGLNIIVAYTARLFQLNLGFSDLKATMVSAIIQTIWALFVFSGVFTIERFGRRPTLIVGTVFCTVGMLGFTVCVRYGTNAAGWAGMVMLIIFYFGFGFGMLPISWLYPAEVLPVHMRHIGEGVGAVTSWVFTFLTLFTGPLSIERLGYKIFILYVVFNFLALPFAYFMMVETKSKSLEEIDFAFSSQETQRQWESRMIEGKEKSDAAEDVSVPADLKH